MFFDGFAIKITRYEGTLLSIKSLMSHNSADKFSKLDVGEDHMNFIRECGT